MESKVSLHIRMPQGIMLFRTGIGRIDRFHTAVETKDEVIEVQTQSQSVCHSQLLVEVLEMELASRLLRIITERPDVSRIDKDCTIKFPEEMRAVFCIEIKFHVTRLVDEVYPSVNTTELSWSQFPYTPAPDRIGTAREIAFLKG